MEVKKIENYFASKEISVFHFYEKLKRIIRKPKREKRYR